MSNGKLKLAISIPIYKRPELLEKSLKSISDAYYNGKYKFQFEIIIIDDSCTSINEDVIQRFVEFHKDFNISYVKNEFNIGIDRNIEKSLFLPETDYIWLLGEDDLIDKNAFLILDEILNINYDFIAVNYATVDNNYKILRNSNFPKDDTLNTTLSYDLFLTKYFTLVGFIGACIYKKSILYNEHYKSYLGSYFSHLSPFLINKENWNIGKVDNILVYNRAENFSSFSWRDQAFDVMFGMVNLTLNRNTSIGELSNKLLRKKLITFQEIYSLKRLFSLRAEGILNFNVYKKYYKAYFIEFPIKSVFVLLISIFPISPLKFLKNNLNNSKK